LEGARSDFYQKNSFGRKSRSWADQIGPPAGSDLKKPSLASQDSSRFRSEDFLQPGLTSYDYSRSWWRFFASSRFGI
jgi:hypothetical protein